MTALAEALERLRDVLSDSRTMQLLAELPATEDAAPLRIAFVGPYNVGKSTLLRVLTGDRSIATDAKPETAEVAWYPWRDVLLGDTPGWFSGFEEHDLASYAALRRDADLVAVVMSVEMGGGPFVAAAHEVLVELGFARRCLLVVNKANAEDHDRDVVAKEVQRRLPKDADVPVVFTDAQDLHDALDPDRAYSDRIREVLRRTSGIGLLEQELDRLVHERGGGARDAATGLQARRVVEAAREAWQPDAEEQALTVLVTDLADRLQGAQDGLRQSFDARVSALEADLADLGEDVAAGVEGAAERAPQDWRAAVVAFQEWVDEHTAAELAALEEASDLSVQALGAHLDAVVDIAGPDEPQRPGGPGLLGRMFRAVDLGPTVVKPVDEALRNVSKQGHREGSFAYALARRLQPNKKFAPYGVQHDAKKIQTVAKGGHKAVKYGGALVPAAIEATAWWRERQELAAAQRRAREVRDTYRASAAKQREELSEHFAGWLEVAFAPAREQVTALRGPLDEGAQARAVALGALDGVDALLAEVADGAG
jgi:ethanolamine utilization protein EutP (predicted NTPase)